MKPQTTQSPQPQPQPVALPFHPASPLVDIACLLRTRGFRLRWSLQHRALELVPVH